MSAPSVVTDRLVGQDAQDQIFRALVASLDGEEVVIRRDAGCSTEGPYPATDGLGLSPGDEVIVARAGTGYIVTSRIVRSGVTSRSFWDAYHQTLLQGFVLGGPIG